MLKQDGGKYIEFIELADAIWAEDKLMLQCSCNISFVVLFQAFWANGWTNWDLSPKACQNKKFVLKNSKKKIDKYLMTNMNYRIEYWTPE